MKSILIFSIAALGIISCKKDKPVPGYGSIRFDVEYKVDDSALNYDTILYTNAAGNKYSINRLEYYLSGFTFIKSDGTTHRSNAVYYVNAQKPATNLIDIGDIPEGSYSSLSFYVGLDSETNKTNYLPNTLDNINMAWPDAMGGGYHFMKMEGYFLDKAGVNKDGYAMHLGKNINLVKIDLVVPIVISKDLLTKTLSMNINEWYKNPANYDFEVDGNYSMGLPNAMSKLTQNGKDVFTIK